MICQEVVESVMKILLVEQKALFITFVNQYSSYNVALLAGVSQTTAWKILRNELHLFPYKICIGQQLSADTKERRKEFCEEFLRKFDSSLNILWSDEAKFSLIATPNRQNTRYWTETVSDVPIIKMPVNYHSFCCI